MKKQAWAAAALLWAAASGYLLSQQRQITTQYPTPLGQFRNLRASSSARLASGAGASVSVGAPANGSPGSALYIAGPLGGRLGGGGTKGLLRVRYQSNGYYAAYAPGLGAGQSSCGDPDATNCAWRFAGCGAANGCENPALPRRQYRVCADANCNPVTQFQCVINPGNLPACLD